MRFSDKKEDFSHMIEAVGLMISLGAVFLQVWVLISGIESYLNGKYINLLPSVILSGIAFLACGGSILLINIDFFKQTRAGRSKTYQNKNL